MVHNINTETKFFFLIIITLDRTKTLFAFKWSLRWNPFQTHSPIEFDFFVFLTGYVVKICSRKTIESIFTIVLINKSPIVKRCFWECLLLTKKKNIKYDFLYLTLTTMGWISKVKHTGERWSSKCQNVKFFKRDLKPICKDFRLYIFDILPFRKKKTVNDSIVPPQNGRTFNVL